MMMRTAQQSPQAPAPVIGAEPLASYPSSGDAASALKYGYGYGSGNEGFMQGQNVDVVGKTVGSRFVTGNTIGMKSAEATSRKITEKRNDKELGDVVTRGALASERSAIAKLGLDPREINFEIPDRKTTIAGEYNRQTGRMNVEAKGESDPSTIVHESIHRGLDLIRKSGDEGRAAVRALPNEENVVRYLMVKRAGDPEGGSGSVDARQRREAIEYFERNPEQVKAIERVERLAEKLIASRKPGGPR